MLKKLIIIQDPETDHERCLHPGQQVAMKHGGLGVCVAIDYNKLDLSVIFSIVKYLVLSEIPHFERFSDGICKFGMYSC